LAPEYSKAAVELKKKGDGYVALAKVDATAEEAIAQNYDIQGFPTLKFFNKASKTVIPYEGARVAEDIIAWVNKKTGPPSEEFDCLEGLATFIEKSATSPVAVFFGQKDDQDLEVFKAVAAMHEKVVFGHTHLDDADEAHNVKEGVKVVLFKGFDEKRNDYTGEMTKEALNEFITVNQNPTLLPFNEKAITAIFQGGSTALFLFANESDPSNAAFDEFAKVAGEFKDKIKFSFSKPNDGFGLFSRLAEYLGADQENLPNLLLVEPSKNNAKYRFTADITADNIRAFLKDFLDEKLERFLKSDEIPESNDAPVKILVGKDFQNLVINNQKDVFVKFYAPWCGHCKQLAPVWDELAEKLASNPNIVIANCDATTNEIPEVEIQSFPTLKFWKNGQKDTPIAFSGDRDLEGLLKFVQENSSHPWVDVNKVEDL
jgi:protein disulfide-isomerase A1